MNKFLSIMAIPVLAVGMFVSWASVLFGWFLYPILLAHFWPSLYVWQAVIGGLMLWWVVISVFFALKI